MQAKLADFRASSKNQQIKNLRFFGTTTAPPRNIVGANLIQCTQLPK
jgi:hypothetical protein